MSKLEAKEWKKLKKALLGEEKHLLRKLMKKEQKPAEALLD